MKTLTITLTTSYANLEREFVTQHRNAEEALSYLTGYVTNFAPFNGVRIKKVEVS